MLSLDFYVCLFLCGERERCAKRAKEFAPNCLSASAAAAAALLAAAASAITTAAAAAALQSEALRRRLE